MKRNCWSVLTLAGGLLIVTGARASAQKLPEIGINRAGLSRQAEDLQQKTLQNFRALHATWLRDGPTSGSPQAIANFVGEVRLAGILHDPYYPQEKIITFGIAHGCDQCAGPPQHLSNPAKIVAVLKNVDGFNYIDNASYRVDGYGTHIYASPSIGGPGVTALLRQDVWALGRDKPFRDHRMGLPRPQVSQQEGADVERGIEGNHRRLRFERARPHRADVVLFV